MSWGLVASAGASLVGGMMSADAAGDAADTQAQASRDATAAQERMYERQVELQEPWRQAGIGGLNRLSYLLGLSPGGGGMETEQQIRNRLSAQYGGSQGVQGGRMVTPTAQANWVPGQPLPSSGYAPVQVDQSDGNAIYAYMPTGAQAQTSGVNQELEAAVQAELARQRATQGQSQAAASKDPAFGSLMRDFGMSDFQADPGYQFRMDEGTKALQRSAAARGGLFSGRAAKDLMRFGQGLGAQEYGSAFDRYQSQNANRFNRLASIAGIGQTAANQTGAAAQRFGDQIGANIIGAGNAQAAGQVGSANAWNNAIGQGVSAYQQNSLLNTLRRPNYGGGGITGGGGFGTGDMWGNQDYGQFF